MKNKVKIILIVVLSLFVSIVGLFLYNYQIINNLEEVNSIIEKATKGKTTEFGNFFPFENYEYKSTTYLTEFSITEPVYSQVFNYRDPEDTNSSFTGVIIIEMKREGFNKLAINDGEVIVVENLDGKNSDISYETIKSIVKDKDLRKIDSIDNFKFFTINNLSKEEVKDIIKSRNQGNDRIDEFYNLPEEKKIENCMNEKEYLYGFISAYTNNQEVYDGIELELDRKEEAIDYIEGLVSVLPC